VFPGVTQAERELDVDDEFEEEEVGIGHGLLGDYNLLACRQIPLNG
jgi:hypothetical protein